MPRTYWVETLGCPKNQVDSDKLVGTIAADGLVPAEAPEDADLVVVNTCAFIERAKAESVEAILDLAEWKGRAPGRRLVVTGCLSQRYGAELLRELPEIDAILGTGELPRIVDVVGRLDRRREWVDGAPPGYVYDATSPRVRLGRVPYAYVKIAEGCDMGCTFCAIPGMRGRHRSRLARPGPGRQRGSVACRACRRRRPRHTKGSSDAAHAPPRSGRAMCPIAGSCSCCCRYATTPVPRSLAPRSSRSARS